MIDPQRPEYDDTPASARRPAFHPQPAGAVSNPPISIVTPCYNVGAWFEETVACVRRQSFQQYEWLLVDDGSTDPQSVSLLERTARQDARVRVIRQANAGPGAARNLGAREARGEFLFWLDSDDLIEPTYLEKALWCLISHPDFEFCNAWPVGFGSERYLWPRGFDRGAENLRENQIDKTALVRRDVHLKMGGFDESIRIGHEDWDYWLSMAEHGCWGWTIPEYLIWYRRHAQSRITLTEGDAARKSAFNDFLRAKHAALFAEPRRFFRGRDLDHLAPVQVSFEVPWPNPLSHPEGRRRLLFIVPWLTMGGADKFNLDVLRQLTRRGWDVTIVTTMPAEHVWLPEFTRLTADVFCMDKFLRMADYPRFLLYLMASRGITHVLVSNSQIAYELLPLLRSHFPEAAFADYCHSAPPGWKDGGYPAMAARWTECLDLHGVSSRQLRHWMSGRGAAAERIEVCYTNIDPEEWSPARFDRGQERRAYLEAGEPEDLPLLVWTGRFVADKRPQFMIEILRELRDGGAAFRALLAGDGELRAEVVGLIDRYDLGRQVRLLGPLSNARIKSLLAAADVYLLPSAVEGVSLALFEAMSMGVVPVSADVGGQAELVTPEVGYLIPHADPRTELRAYVEVLRRLIDDPAHRRRLSEAARARIVAHFNLDEMGRRMHEMLLAAGENRARRDRPSMPPRTAAQCAAVSMDRLRLELLADQLWLRLHAPSNDAAGAGVDPASAPLDAVRAQLAFIENSRFWRTIQYLRRVWPSRLFVRPAPGQNGNGAAAAEDPRDRLRAIRESRSYRLVRAVKRTPLYRAYARRKYGPNFVDNWA
ncbi:MAG: glycosyltransferase [Phycisphaerae bacterium]|jgi:glycosyltransferase involved in cell wall biosynthesis